MVDHKGCPCGSRLTYRECCKPLHRGDVTAQTAEQLMRSRYSAFSKGEVDYLISTHHPDRRQPNDRQELVTNIAAIEWVALKIVDTAKGTSKDSVGTVEFVATFIENGKIGQLRERSEFIKENGRWFYLHGSIHK